MCVRVCVCVCVQYDNTEDLFEVPKLGKHYSRRWALDDLSEEQKESQRLGSMADPLAMWDKVAEKNEKDGFGNFNLALMY